MAEQKFPSEVIDLPSEGKLYPKGHPLKDGKIEIKYMTAKEEDILTSTNLVKKGLAVDTLLKSLIVNKDVDLEDLVLGDKNAVMVAARVLAYGPEYSCDIQNPNTGETILILLIWLSVHLKNYQKKLQKTNLKQLYQFLKKK